MLLMIAKDLSSTMPVRLRSHHESKNHPNAPLVMMERWPVNKNDQIRKLLEDVKADERGWNRTCATAEGHFSKRLAEENLRRLAALRQMLLSQLSSADLHQQGVVEAAIQNGLITDDLSETVAECLLRHR
jgi:hypothetical protein